jgi:hypothetical protein
LSRPAFCRWCSFHSRNRASAGCAKFFRLGIPALAAVVDFRPEDVGFEVKLTRVRYEFVADGQTWRGSDLTLPVIADRWRAGDRIEILYLPGRNYDSMIATIR